MQNTSLCKACSSLQARGAHGRWSTKLSSKHAAVCRHGVRQCRTQFARQIAALPVPPPACLSAWTRCALLPGPDAIVPASPRSRRPRDTRPALSRARGQPRDSTRCASVWSPGPHVLCGFSQERAPLPRPVAPATGRRMGQVRLVLRLRPRPPAPGRLFLRSPPVLRESHKRKMNGLQG